MGGRSRQAPSPRPRWRACLPRKLPGTSSGVEELTPQGRSALNSTLAGYGERILDSPVIVEGYCEGDELNDRFAASRHQAIPARNYLQIRFNLDINRVGTSDRTILISAIRQWRFFFMGLILRLSSAKRADPLRPPAAARPRPLRFGRNWSD